MNDTLTKIQHRVLDLGDAVRPVRRTAYTWGLPNRFYDDLESRVVINWRLFGHDRGWVA